MLNENISFKDFVKVVDDLEESNEKLKAEIEKLKQKGKEDLQKAEFKYKDQILDLKIKVKELKLSSVDSKFNNMVDFMKRNGNAYRVDFYCDTSTVDLYSSLNGRPSKVDTFTTFKTAKIILTPTCQGLEGFHYEDEI